MFVPHEPDRIFNIQRSNDRCVCCGASALITYHDGIHKGYCKECAKKRQKFTERIIGNINIEQITPVIPAQSWINIVEQIRQNYMQERIYYMIDLYFTNANTTSAYNNIEPYNDDNFIYQTYYEKAAMMKNFVQNIKDHLNDNLSNQIYTFYLRELNKMYENDYDAISKLDAKINGYQYKKSKPMHPLIKNKSM